MSVFFLSFPFIGPSADVLRKQPLLNHKLNATEIAAVHQLVTGYRDANCCDFGSIQLMIQLWLFLEYVGTRTHERKRQLKIMKSPCTPMSQLSPECNGTKTKL